MSARAFAGWFAGLVAAASIAAVVIGTPCALGQTQSEGHGDQTLAASTPPQPTSDSASSPSALDSRSTVLKNGAGADSQQAPAVIPVAATVNMPTDATVQHSPQAAGMASKVKAVVVSLIPMTPAQRVKFEEGIAAFPSFCHEWEQKLRDRELNNLDHLAWQVRDGYETATYVGYSNVESCETKPTRTTLLGKLKYEELRYYLVGKTVDATFERPGSFLVPWLETFLVIDGPTQKTLHARVVIADEDFSFAGPVGDFSERVHLDPFRAERINEKESRVITDCLENLRQPVLETA